VPHPAKRKGDAAELEAARLLADHTGFPVRRKLGAGRTDDCGDLDGLPDTCVQVKAYRDITRAIREVLDELPGQQTNSGATFGFGMVRRPGGRWFAVLTIEQITCLLREAIPAPTCGKYVPPIAGLTNGYYCQNPLPCKSQAHNVYVSTYMEKKENLPDPLDGLPDPTIVTFRGVEK
jgi:hypothetical protein